MSIQATCREALESIQVDIGDTASWNSLTLPCVASQLSRGAVVAVAGSEVTIDLTLYVDQSDVTSGTPGAGQVLTYKSVIYRIASAIRSASDSHWKIELTSNEI